MFWSFYSLGKIVSKIMLSLFELRYVHQTTNQWKFHVKTFYHSQENSDKTFLELLYSF